MKITATDLKGFGIVDEIVPEPAGGAHADPDSLFRCLDAVLDAQLRELSALPAAELVDARYRKFRELGALGREFTEVPPAPGPRP